jgi:hypothetical protein
MARKIEPTQKSLRVSARFPEANTWYEIKEPERAAKSKVQ